MFFDLAVVGLMYFAALAWGSNEDWAIGLISALGIGLLAFRLAADAWKREVRVPRAWIYVPLLLFLAFSAFAPSVEKSSTTKYLLLAASYVSIVALVHMGFRSRVAVRLLILSIFILGIFEGLYGLVQYFGKINFIWDFSRAAGLGVASGTFINRNHYALLMNLCICSGFGVLFYVSLKVSRGRPPSLRTVLTSSELDKLIWIFLPLIMMGLALIFSMSRMGITAMFFSVGAMMVAGQAAKRKRAFAIALGLIVATWSVAAYAGLDLVLARFMHMVERQNLYEDRLPLWQDAWKMIREHPVIGQGLGTFQWTFPAYETVGPDIPARYAHNDYLQALAEVGIIGLVLLLTALMLAYRTALINLFRSKDSLARGIGMGTLGALTAVMMQEITDFGLYIPGVAVVVAVLVGINLKMENGFEIRDSS
jgi:O-antigen ligase